MCLQNTHTHTSETQQRAGANTQVCLYRHVTRAHKHTEDLCSLVYEVVCAFLLDVVCVPKQPDDLITGERQRHEHKQRLAERRGERWERLGEFEKKKTQTLIMKSSWKQNKVQLDTLFDDLGGLEQLEALCVDKTVITKCYRLMQCR